MQASLSLRDIALEVIRKLPASTSAEEIMYQINLVANILEGLKDAEQGNTLSTADVLLKVKTWQK